MAEFRDLEIRLSTLAAVEADYIGDDAVRIRNACFDAMACIKALEARLSKERDANAIMRETRSPSRSE